MEKFDGWIFKNERGSLLLSTIGLRKIDAIDNCHGFWKKMEKRRL